MQGETFLPRAGAGQQGDVAFWYIKRFRQPADERLVCFAIHGRGGDAHAQGVGVRARRLRAFGAGHGVNGEGEQIFAGHGEKGTDAAGALDVTLRPRVRNAGAVWRVMKPITVNGESVPLQAPIDIATLLAQRGLAGKRVAVERNGEIVPKSQHAHTVLTGGEVLEIVAAVGGG